MTRRQVTTLCFLLLLVTVPVAADPYEIKIQYRANSGCIEVISDIAVREILRDDHDAWFDGDSADGPVVRWNVHPDIANYEWTISHKTDNVYATELDHFDSTTSFADTWEIEARRGADKLQEKHYTWHYDVSARWTGAADACPEVEPLDPQVVFNGGSGATMLPGWFIAAIAGLLALVLLVYLLARRRAA